MVQMMLRFIFKALKAAAMDSTPVKFIMGVIKRLSTVAANLSQKLRDYLTKLHAAKASGAESEKKAVAVFEKIQSAVIGVLVAVTSATAEILTASHYVIFDEEIRIAA